MNNSNFIAILPGKSRLILSLPHTGTDIPTDLAANFISPWRTRADTDWWLEKLYDFAESRDITIIRTTISRSIIDVNRDPGGASLYPGMATTSLCPTTDFDGKPLYITGHEPDETEIAGRRLLYFDPYHTALTDAIARLRRIHDNIVLFDAHSIRSHVPRLFEGLLPVCNIGSNDGASAASSLVDTITSRCAASPFTYVLNGRFKGGYITRHYGAPTKNVHAVQLELACRAYIDEPATITATNWPPPYNPERAAEIRDLLVPIIDTCLTAPLAKQ